MEPTQSTAPHLSNIHTLLPSRSSATLVASPIVRPSGKFSQPSSTEYELKVAFCCAKPWPASNANTAAHPNAPQRTGIEALRDIALLRFRTALSRFSTAPRQYCDSNACLSWTDLSEDSREIIEALVHGAYRGRTRLGTRITEDALRLTAPH